MHVEILYKVVLVDEKGCELVQHLSANLQGSGFMTDAIVWHFYVDIIHRMENLPKRQ